MFHARVVHGVEVPGFVYGPAWKEERTAELVRRALQAGFRGIDTANQRRHYVEAAVGEAVAEALDAGELTRAELFLQTKFTFAEGQDHRLPYDPSADVATQVHQSFERSLLHLQTPYVDALILHGPRRSMGLTDYDWKAWGAMESLKKGGKANLIGVSNVSLDQLTSLVGGASVKPALVQNRCFARAGWDLTVRELCEANGIAYQGFSLLTANARELSEPSVVALARQKGCTVPQLVFRFAAQVGVIPLTGTTSGVHMKEDLAASDLTLTEDETHLIDRCGLGV
jgi:diketogulonate reductase-like aldo/keto reductase